MITATRDDKEITRNASFYKKIEPHAVKQEIYIDDDDDDPEQMETPIPVQEDLPSAEETPQRRYPTRDSRKPPEYLKDYECR